MLLEEKKMRKEERKGERERKRGKKGEGKKMEFEMFEKMLMMQLDEKIENVIQFLKKKS